jgi:hypothetical protein
VVARPGGGNADWGNSAGTYVGSGMLN